MRPKNSSPRLLLVVSPAMVLLAIAVTWLVFFGTSTAETDSKKNIPEVDSSAKTSKALECGMRKLALEYARSIHSWRDPDDELFRHIHDALQLTNMCGQVPPESTTSTRNQTMDTINKKAREIQQAESKLLAECDQTEIFRCIYVTTKNPSDDDSGDGSFEHPIGCLHKALALSRSARKNSDTPNDYMPTRIILREGVHELHYKPLLLTGDIDSDLELVAYPGEDVWISGGMAVPSDLTWKRWNENDHVWVTNLKEALKGHADKLPSVFCLFTVGSSTAEHQRLIRARYPNGNPELDQWGYISPGRDLVSIPKDVVLEWHKADAGPIPTFDYILLDKNDSTMDGYNMYASGHGGVCASQWGPDADSYWCSNYSQGGWSEVDRECAMTGQLQIPVGMTLNTSAPAAQPLSRLSEDDLQGGIVFAWHSQTWAMHMFRISGVSNEMTDKSSSDVDSFYFEKGGGKQGGRNWCKCNQCTYAGAFCGQHKDPPDNSDTRLIGGNWFVENLLPELDQAGEYFYSPATGDLYVYPNITEDYSTAWQENLRFAVLDNIVEIRNASNVGITNIGFRDSAATYMSDWSAPSGGDWALHRGGAVFLESTKDVLIRGCLFRRLDGNAVFLSRWNRHTLIEKNTFEWLGENAIATWGDTDKYDATVGNQPWQTMIYKNVMRELGIYQKQSSAVGQAKAALSDIHSNIMFNMPRAGINFNDMMGGGDKVANNLMFNTCRESGDHGPINSWDRQPFLTTMRDGATPSFDPLPRKIRGNFIFANYGADQAVDNDDGSSYFHVLRNLFYDASGFKMDYGGHDSLFEENLVMAMGRKKCIGFGSFKEGHGDIVQNNTCIVGLQKIQDDATNSADGNYMRDPTKKRLWSDHEDNVASLERCEGSNAILRTNKYYTPHGNASFTCSYAGGGEISLEEVQTKYGLDLGSTTDIIPPVHILLYWARQLLFLEEADSASWV